MKRHGYNPENTSNDLEPLGRFRVVISMVISPLIWVITIVTLLITPLIIPLFRV